MTDLELLGKTVLVLQALEVMLKRLMGPSRKPEDALVAIQVLLKSSEFRQVLENRGAGHDNP